MLFIFSFLSFSLLNTIKKREFAQKNYLTKRIYIIIMIVIEKKNYIFIIISDADIFDLETSEIVAIYLICQ